MVKLGKLITPVINGKTQVLSIVSNWKKLQTFNRQEQVTHMVRVQVVEKK